MQCLLLYTCLPQYSAFCLFLPPYDDDDVGADAQFHFSFQFVYSHPT